MRVFSIPVPSTKTSLKVLLGDANPRTTSIKFQAPDMNANVIYFGDHKVQPFELRPKANMTVQHQNIRDIYVRGTPPDLLSVMLA